jgi:hypothetical protein
MAQMVAALEVFHYNIVCVPHQQAGKKFWDSVVVCAICKHGAIDIKGIGKSNDIVVGAVTRCGMHKAGAVLKGDVIATNDRACSVTEDMVVQQANKCLTLCCPEYLGSHPNSFGDL